MEKTRLALEAVIALRAAGWSAGILPRAALDPARGGRDDIDSRLERFFERRGDTGALLVLDYAESRTWQVERVTRAALRAPEGSPIKIVLITRSPVGWWEEARTASREIQLVYDAKPVTAVLNDIEPDEREAFFLKAAHAFADQLAAAQSEDEHLLAPDWRKRPVPLKRLMAPSTGSPLSLAFEAFLHVRGIDATDSPLAEMALEERRHWMRALRLRPRDSLQLYDKQCQSVHRCAAVLTLLQGTEPADEGSTNTALDRILDAALGTFAPLGVDDLSRAKTYADARRVVDLLYRHQRRTGDLLEPVVPDLLGEYIVGECLGTDRYLMGAVLDAFPQRAMEALSLVQRSIDGLHTDRVKDSFVSALAESLVGRVSSDIADVLCEVASAGGGRFLRCVEALVPRLKETDIRHLIKTAWVSARRLSTVSTAVAKRLLTFPSGVRDGGSLLDTVREYAHSAMGYFHEGALDKAIEINEQALKLLDLCQIDDPRHSAIISSSILTNDANIKAAKDDWDGAIQAIEGAKRPLVPYFLTDPECTRQAIIARSQAATIYRKAGRREESLRNGAEASTVAADLWEHNSDSLVYRDLEIVAAACCNYAGTLLEVSSQDAGRYYRITWEASLAMNRIAPSPQVMTMTVAYGRYLYLEEKAVAKAKDVLVAGARAAQTIGNSDLQFVETFHRIVGSIATCMRALNADESEIREMGEQFGVRFDGTDASSPAQTLYNHYLELHDVALKIPTPESGEARESARKELEEYLSKHSDDPFVQDIRARLRRIEQDSEAANRDPVVIRAQELMERWAQLVTATPRLQTEAEEKETRQIIDSLSQILTSEPDNPGLYGLRNLFRIDRERSERLSRPSSAKDRLSLDAARGRVAEIRAVDVGEDKSLSLAVALQEMADSAYAEGNFDEAATAVEEAITVLGNLMENGRVDAVAYFAIAQAILGRLLTKQKRWYEAACAYLLGAQAYRAAPETITNWASEVFRELTHGFIHTASEAGSPRSEIDRCLGMIGALAVDPDNVPVATKYYAEWVEAHNERRTGDARSHYAKLFEALESDIDNESLDPVRYTVHDTVARMGAKADYSPLPTLKRQSP